MPGQELVLDGAVEPLDVAVPLRASRVVEEMGDSRRFQMALEQLEELRPVVGLDPFHRKRRDQFQPLEKIPRRSRRSRIVAPGESEAGGHVHGGHRVAPDPVDEGDHRVDLHQVAGEPGTVAGPPELPLPRSPVLQVQLARGRPDPDLSGNRQPARLPQVGEYAPDPALRQALGNAFPPAKGAQQRQELFLAEPGMPGSQADDLGLDSPVHGPLVVLPPGPAFGRQGAERRPRRFVFALPSVQGGAAHAEGVPSRGRAVLFPEIERLQAALGDSCVHLPWVQGIGELVQQGLVGGEDLKEIRGSGAERHGSE